MRKTTWMTLLAAAAIMVNASAQGRNDAPKLPQGKMLKLDSKEIVTKKAPIMRADAELVTPPESATFETTWELTGDYINNGSFYKNNNPITVAFDGSDVYIQGISNLCPDGWIKGTIDGETATFANGQYVGVVNLGGDDYDIYVCGSTDGEALDDVVFSYTGRKFALSNYYLENTSTTQMNYFYYSSDLVLTKPIASPTEVEVEPAATTADVSWTENEDATEWNVRYRKYVDITLFEDFENGVPEDWTNIDADGDGHKWYAFTPSGSITDGQGNPWVMGTTCATSASYVSGTVLTPDNWLITPQVELGGTLSVWLRAQDIYYPGEHFAIYLSTTGNTVDDFTTVLVDETVSEKVYTEYTADLSAYEGLQGYIAIRHFNCTDMFRLNVDNFSISSAALEEWTEVEGVTENPYTITDLEPETKYEVQVQSVLPATRATGANVSDWSESTIFTTLDDTTAIETVKTDTLTSDNSYYNLMGQKVSGSNLPAGIYIQGGKKIIVR